MLNKETNFLIKIQKKCFDNVYPSGDWFPYHISSPFHQIFVSLPPFKTSGVDYA